MKIFCLLSLFFLSDLSLSKETFQEVRRNKLLLLINKEMKTIQTVKRKSARLKYRLFELMSEKVKIFKEEENNSFIKKNTKNRKIAFKKTLKMYKETQDYGLLILKDKRVKSFRSAIYYTLGLNSRDYSYDKNEYRYLKKAISYSRGKHKINYLAKVSLAEYYYNQKQYLKATKIYKNIIHNKQDEWYTKNLYNYGWCLLKTKKFKTAIRRLEESYLLSGSSQYIDMREQSITGLINFYIYGKEIQRGISFIEQNSTDKAQDLLTLVKKASKKGFIKESYNLIENIDLKIQSSKDKSLLLELRLFEFEFYQQEHNKEKLLSTARSLSKIKLSKDETSEAIHKISNYVGIQQIILKKDFSKEEKSYNSSLLKDVIAYFEVLSLINKKEKSLYYFYIAETFFSVEENHQALKTYKDVLAIFEKTPASEDLRAKSLDAIFSLIESINFTQKEKREELKFAFKKYLHYWPKTLKAQKIYPRLYAILLEENNYNQAELILDLYIKNFKKQRKEQRELYKNLIDLIIAKKDTELLASKIRKMQKGFLNFPKKEVIKSEKILANILFDELKQMSAKGLYKEALKGLGKIYLTPYYPRSIKAEAAFNSGINFTNLGNNKDAFKWYSKSFRLYASKEKKDKRNILEKMALRTSLLQDHIHASKLDLFILRKFCWDKKKNITTFRRITQNLMARDYMNKLVHTFQKYKKCIKKIPKDLYSSVLIHLYENGHERTLISLVSDHNLKISHKEELAQLYEDLFWKYYLENPKKEKLFFYHFKMTAPEKAEEISTSFKELKELKKKISIFQEQKIKITATMTPDLFSQEISKRMGILPGLIEKANALLAKGHQEISLFSYSELTKLTASFKQEILQYKLPIKDKGFQKQFATQMSSLAQSIHLEEKQYLKLAQEMIEKYEIISPRVKLFFESLHNPNPINIRAPASLFATTIDIPRNKR